MRTARSSTVQGGGVSVTETPLDRDHPGQRSLWTEITLDRDPLDRDPPCGQTDACENITLSQTSFVGGIYAVHELGGKKGTIPLVPSLKRLPNADALILCLALLRNRCWN